MKRVLVTGGAGFLGRYVIDRCLARGWAVTSFQRSPAADLAARGVAIREGSLTDAVAVAAAVAGQDAVFHVAAKAGIWGPREDFWAVNVLGTRHVIEACRRHGVGRLVHTSTPSVVFTGASFAGADESLPYGRDWLCAYAETKAIAEAEVLAAHGATLQTCALRPHLIWGVGDPHLLPRVVARARAGRLRIVGDGTNRVDLTHVRNAAEAHLQALDALERGVAGGRAYFLSQGEPVELWPWVNGLLAALALPPVSRKIGLASARRLGAVCELGWRILRLGGEPPMTRFVATELGKDHWFSIEAARRDLGYQPERFPTAEGLREYVKALQAQATPL